MKTKLHALRIATELYKEVEKHNFSNPIRDQFRRAALSIALNITEGTGRTTPKDRERFFDIALGSLRECQTLAELTGIEKLVQGYHHLGGYIYGLCRSTKKQLN
jgi:four helix bundle protein